MNNYSEKFEKMRIAGKLASNTLDMITNCIKPGISTEEIDRLCFEYIRDNGGYSAPLFYTYRLKILHQLFLQVSNLYYTLHRYLLLF